MTRKSRKSPSKEPDSSSDFAARIFSTSLSYLLDQITAITTGKVTPKGHDPASRVAWLAGRAASVAAEQRKAEKGELDAILRLSPAVVLKWIKGQSADYRARLVREVAAIDSQDRKSVLG